MTTNKPEVFRFHCHGQSAAFEAFKNWWDHEDQEEMRRSCAQGWAWKVWQARADMDSEQQPDVTQLVEALEEGLRAIGDHHAPDDCYATGPMTGDPFRDLVQCPACSFIAMCDTALAAHRKQGGGE